MFRAFNSYGVWDNHIDSSAVESLLEFNKRLKDKGIKMHLSEVKGPVLDRLKRVNFAEHLTGTIYLSQHQAWQDLTKGLTKASN